MNRRFVEDLLATYPTPDDLEWSTDTVRELLSEIVRLKERARLCSEELGRVEIELAEAQQWIDSEPGWEEKYMSFYMALFHLNQRLYTRTKKAEARVKELEEGIEKTAIGMGWTKEENELYALIGKKGGEGI
jgi:hypothetical protein